jgi:hypothetical protein
MFYLVGVHVYLVGVRVYLVGVHVLFSMCSCFI